MIDNNIYEMLDQSLITPNAYQNRTTKPSFFRLPQTEDRKKLTALLKQNSPPIILDTIHAQIGELIKTRFPKETFESAHLNKKIRDFLAGQKSADYGVWVYYPWLNKLIHLLDKSEFIELRTNRNRYKITEDEQKIIAQKNVGIIGLSVGKANATALTMERDFGCLKLVDFDYLELSNINRIQTSLTNLGLEKVVIAAREIAEIDPFLDVRCYFNALSKENLDDFLLKDKKLDLIIEECDDIALKFIVRYRARELGIPVLMETSDRGLVDVERFDLEPNRPIFHGLVEELDPEDVKDLSTEDKVPYVLDIIGKETISDRLIASLAEVKDSISTWPSLGSCVLYGAGVIANVARRMFLGQFNVSGRFFVDVDTIISDNTFNQKLSKNIESETQKPYTSISPQRNSFPEEYMHLVAFPLIPHPQAIVPNRETMHYLVDMAIQAPSGGNVQPWLWVVKGQWLQLYLDPIRSITVLDFNQNASLLALGTACENLVIAAQQRDLDVNIHFLAEKTQNRLVAAFEFFHQSENVLLKEKEKLFFSNLFPCLKERCTNRLVGSGEKLTKAELAVFFEITKTMPGAELTIITDKQDLATVARIVGDGDRLRFLDKDFHRQMMAEMRWTQAEVESTRDGIDINTMELSETDKAGLYLCRSWAAMKTISIIGGGYAFGKVSRNLIKNSSGFALLTMPDMTKINFFNGGRIIERIWLTACKLGLIFEPMTVLPYFFARLIHGDIEKVYKKHLGDLQKLRREYQCFFPVDDHKSEIMLFRLAKGMKTENRSLRRNLEDVLFFNP